MESVRMSLDMQRDSFDFERPPEDELRSYLYKNGLQSVLQPLDLSPLQTPGASPTIQLLLDNVAQQLSSSYEMLLGTTFLGQELVEGSGLSQSLRSDIIGVVSNVSDLPQEEIHNLNPNRNFEYFPHGKLVILEMKKPKSAERTIWTQLTACSSSLRTWLPPLREVDTLLVAICPVDQNTIWVYYDFLLFHHSGPVIMLRPEWETAGDMEVEGMKLRLIPVVPLGTDLISFFDRVHSLLSIKTNSLPGAMIRLSGLQGNSPELKIDKTAMMTCVQYILNKERLHGYAFIQQVGTEILYLTIRVMNPYLLAKKAYENDFKGHLCVNVHNLPTRYYKDQQGNLVCHNCAAVCYQGSLSPVDENNEELVLGDQDCHCGGEFICKLECCSLSHYLHHLGLYKNSDDEEGDLDELIEDWETGVRLIAESCLSTLVPSGRKKEYIDSGVKSILDGRINKNNLVGFFVFGITRELYLKYVDTLGLSAACGLYDADTFIQFLDSCDINKEEK